MRRILLTVTGTLSGLGLLFLYPTSTHHPVTADGGTATGVAGGTSPGSSSGSSAGSPAGSPAGSSSGAGGSTGPSGTYSATTSMRYGSVTVTITVVDGRVTQSSGSEDAGDGRSQMIARQSMPTLDAEAVEAQSAAIAMVSHATYTSEAYAESLQAALDQAAGS